MSFIPQLIFALLATAATLLFAKKIKKIRHNILLGKEEDYSGNTGARWKNVILLALGQKKMFKNPLVAVMHIVIYAGFIIINLEVLEIVLDGLLGKHRLFLRSLGNFYSILINSFEFLAVGVIVVCIVFLIRRNQLKIRRFISKDLVGWPRSDANYILITEIILMSLFITMNATDTMLQSRGVGHYADHVTGDFLLVAAYCGHICFSKLPALLKTPAYFVGLSKRLLCQATTCGTYP
jgi:hypothetical protein